MFLQLFQIFFSECLVRDLYFCHVIETALFSEITQFSVVTRKLHCNLDADFLNLSTMIDKRPTVLILNSAHSKYPIGTDPWIQATKKAVNSLAGQPVKMLSSTEPVMWDIVTVLAGKNGMEIILIVNARNDREGQKEFKRLIREFALDKNRTSPLYLGESAVNQPKKLWIIRDNLALKTADVVYPVSIRPGGKLDNLLLNSNINAEVRNDFRIDWLKKKETEKRLVYDFSDLMVNPFPEGEWLVHWTRSSQGSWPGEKAWEYYRDLFENPHTYVRSARETLIKILTERLIRGSSWKLPGGVKAVSLTSLAPDEAVPLMRWRKRFVMYSFEPYGVAIKRDILVLMGARKVQYEKPYAGSSSDKLFVQSPGEKGNWTKEKEWRIRGDLRLNTIDRKDYFAIVPDESDSVNIKKRIKGKDVYFHVLFKS